MIINLNTCKAGDILISSHGAILEYVSPTHHLMGYTTLDHVVRYLIDENGKEYSNQPMGSRTSDGFVYKNERMPEFDHDIVKIRHIVPKSTELKSRNENYYSDSVIASYDIKLDGYHMVGKNPSGIAVNFFLEREHIKDYFFEN